MAERAKQIPQAIRTALKSLKNKLVNFAVTSCEHTKSYPFARAKPEGRPRAIKPAKASPTEWQQLYSLPGFTGHFPADVVQHKTNKAPSITTGLENICLMGCTQLQLRVRVCVKKKKEHNVTAKVGPWIGLFGLGNKLNSAPILEENDSVLLLKKERLQNWTSNNCHWWQLELHLCPNRRNH